MQTNLTKLMVTFCNSANMPKHNLTYKQACPCHHGALIILAILYTLNYVHYEVLFSPDNNHSDLRALNGLLSKQQQGQHLTKEWTTSTFLVIVKIQSNILCHTTSEVGK
jgi:hypothetical protein